MNRFFVAEENFRDDQVLFGQQHAHQIRHVLRAKPGDYVVVLDNQGHEYDVILTAVSRGEVRGEAIGKRLALCEPRVHVTLYQSLLSRYKFEWVLQKCTEVGVTRFVPIITQRSLVRDADAKPSKLARWQRIITEAAEQSERGRIPELLPPVNLQTALSGLADFDLCVMASPQAEEVGLRSCLRHCPNVSPEKIAVFVGPEGGFTDEEVGAGRDSGVLPVSLGPRILRTETAAVVATAILLYELEQMDA